MPAITVNTSGSNKAPRRNKRRQSANTHMPFPNRIYKSIFRVHHEEKTPDTDAELGLYDAFGYYLPLNGNTLTPLAEDDKFSHYRIIDVEVWGETATTSSTQIACVGNAIYNTKRKISNWKEVCTLMAKSARMRKSTPGGVLHTKIRIPQPIWIDTRAANSDEVPFVLLAVSDWKQMSSKALWSVRLTVEATMKG